MWDPGNDGHGDVGQAALRDRLVRLCARLSGDSAAAEDLAQETLLEAWRQADKLHDPTGYVPWLWAIARYVCRRHVRRQGRDVAWLSHADAPETDVPSDAVDLEIDLERDELAALLDQAMAQLPPLTRSVLLERYLHETPLAEVAGRLGLTEGAVAVRLHRGRLALRRLLSTQYQAEAARHGLVDAASGGWQPTRLWCATCGQHHLDVRLTPDHESIAFRCPGCQAGSETPNSAYRLTNAHFARLLGGLSRPSAILNRAAGWVHGYYRDGLEVGVVPCTNCGRPTPLRRFTQADNPPGLEARHGLYVQCDACGEAVLTSFSGLVQALPEVHQFWRRHRRLRTLPASDIEVDGRSAVVSRFESVTSQDALEVVSVRDTYQVIGIYPSAGSGGQ